MDGSKIARALGIVGALLVPAVVVAQQFTQNQPLRAADLQALVVRVDQLTQRVAVLESEARTGPSAQRFALVVTDGSYLYTAAEDGFVVVVPGGTGFQSVVTQAVVGGTGRHFRASDGNTITAIVSQGEQLTVTVNGLVSTADVTLYWFPLHRDAPAPICAGGCGI